MSIGLIPRAWPVINRGIQQLEHYPGGPRGFAEDVVRGVRFGYGVYKGVRETARAWGVHKLVQNSGSFPDPSLKRPRPNDSFVGPMVKRRRTGSLRHRRRRRSRFGAVSRRHRGKSRRRFGRSRFGRRGRGRMFHRGSMVIPNLASREFSMVTRITLVAAFMPLTYAFTRQPTQMFEFFKEFRLERVLCAVRRRRPPGSVFETAQGGTAVSAGREETNDIFWLPWSTVDMPRQHPRQIRSARMLTSAWTVAHIRQRCIETKIVNRPTQAFLDSASTPNTMITNSDWTQSTNRLNGFLVQSWTKMPWQQVDGFYTGGGTGVRTSDTGYIPAPGSNPNAVAQGANTFDSTSLYLGFLYVDNKAAMLYDEVEVRVKITWRFRGRKPLGQTSDTSGALGLIGLQNPQSQLDRVGAPSGPLLVNTFDYDQIHVPYTGPPDPGDVCFPCGPTPAYVVPPP
ncbi:capsid protein [robinz virus RP_334]|nr:capsid protein [robinz virus RP_334]